MTKTKHSKMGKRLIAAMKEVVDHVEGRTALPLRYVEVPEDVDVRAIRSKLGLSQAEFSRRYAVSPRSLQEWEQGRRRPESAVRAYLTVIDRNPEAVEKALVNQPGDAKRIRHENRLRRTVPTAGTRSCPKRAQIKV
jgi:putative transcriptional regulator